MNNFNNFNPYAYYPQYGNQAFQNPYQQAMNPVTAPVQQMQSMQPQPMQVPSLNGRVISNVNEVRVQDVPTDGNVAIFPMNDRSCIYMKQWNAEGTIDTVRYIPERVEPVNAPQVSIVEEMNDIRAQLNRIEKALSRNNFRGKKVEANESAE